MESDLHSTMFLLIHRTQHPNHYTDLYLHSTMFLLILNATKTAVTTVWKFTFHNVSINTELTGDRTLLLIDLHSTMFLLILGSELLSVLLVLYLHSTMFLLIPVVDGHFRGSVRDLHSTMFLLIRGTRHLCGCGCIGLIYIPQCFY